MKKKRRMKMRIEVVGCIIFAFLPIISKAQFQENIASDRPGQAISALTVGKKIFQVQAGFDYNKYNYSSHDIFAISRFDESTTVDLQPVVDFRYGISEVVEFNSTIAYTNRDYSSESESYILSGLSQMEFGLRTNILKGEGHYPALAFQYSLKVPPPSDDFKLNYLASRIKLAASQKIGKKIGLAVNIGADWIDDSPDEIGLYVVNLSYSITEKLGIFAEQYGSLDYIYWTGKVDGGVAFQVSNNLQLDAYGGWGSFGEDYDEEHIFASIGISWRTTRK